MFLLLRNILFCYSQTYTVAGVTSFRTEIITITSINKRIKTWLYRDRSITLMPRYRRVNMKNLLWTMKYVIMIIFFLQFSTRKRQNFFSFSTLFRNDSIVYGRKLFLSNRMKNLKGECYEIIYEKWFILFFCFNKLFHYLTCNNLVKFWKLYKKMCHF